MRVAAYCRVSTEKEDQVHSLLNQQQYFRTYIENHEDWELVEIFVDEGMTGTSTKKRIEFNRMIAMAKNKEFDLILTKEVSRFARNTVDTLTYTRELKSVGVGVYFINDHINTLDNEGEFRLTIMASVAQEESRKTSERVKWGQKRRMEQGVVFGNSRILGYDLKGGKLTVNETESKIVKEIFDKYVLEQKGARIIANELNEQGVRPVYAACWSPVTILNILKNEKYMGDVAHKKYVTDDYLTHKKKFNKEKDGVIYIRDNHEAIIDRATWSQAQELMRARSKGGSDGRKYSSKYWCSGKLFCGVCGAKLVSVFAQSKGNKVQSWYCSNRKKNGIHSCHNHRIRSDHLLLCLHRASALYLNHALALKKEMLHEIRRSKIHGKLPNPAELQQQFDILEKRKKNFADDLLHHKISLEEFKLLHQTIAANQELLQSKRTEWETRNDLMQQEAENHRQLLQSLNEIFDAARIPVTFYEHIVDKVTVYPRKMEVQFRGLPMVFEVQFKMSRANQQYSFDITEASMRTLE